MATATATKTAETSYTIDDDKGIVMVLRILQDGMDWEYIVQQWIQVNS